MSSRGTLRLGVRAAEGSSAEWLLRRNCSLSPRQLASAYAVLCLPSLAVASFFWVQGARLVMPFAWLELLAVGAAMLVFARHVGDGERIALQGRRLTVELTRGSQVDRVEFEGDWVRVEPAARRGGLVELTSCGRRVAVGRHLRPELRPVLADELRSVLRGLAVQPGMRQSEPNSKPS